MERHATEVVWQRPDNRRASSTVLAISSMRLPYYSRAHIRPPFPPKYITCIFHLASNVDFNSRGIETVTKGKNHLAKELDASKCSSRLHISPKHFAVLF